MFKKLYLILLIIGISSQVWAEDASSKVIRPLPAPGGVADLRKKIEAQGRVLPSQPKPKFGEKAGIGSAPGREAITPPQSPKIVPSLSPRGTQPQAVPAQQGVQGGSQPSHSDALPVMAGELPGVLSKTPEGRTCLIPPKRRLWILIIDGGGIRGIIPSIVVEALEKDLGIPISIIIDVFGGTSVGGIEVLGYTKPKSLKNGVVIGDDPAYTAQMVKELNINLGKVIFSEKNKLINILTTGSLYTKTALESALDSFFGDTKISQSLKPVYITSFELNSEANFIISTGLAKLASNVDKRRKLSAQQISIPLPPLEGGYSGISLPASIVKGEWPFDLLMVQAARATSAAPFYFPVASHALDSLAGTKMQLIDGGIGNNNPSATIVAEIDKEYCTPPAIGLISLGTGVARSYFKDIDFSKQGGPLRMANPLITGFFNAQEQNTQETMKEYIGIRNAFLSIKSHYWRLQSLLEKGQDKLDNASPEMIKLLIEKGEVILKTPEYKQVVAALKQDLCDGLVYCREENKIGNEGLHQKMCPSSRVACPLKKAQTPVLSPRGMRQK